MTGLHNTNSYLQVSKGYYSPTYNHSNSQQSVYSFNPYQSSQYDYYKNAGQPNNADINAVMRSRVMPVPSRGYTEMLRFDVPFLNTKGTLYKLDNGQGVVIIPKKGPTTIKTFVKVGSFNEKKRGISHYIEHNLFNGSKGLAPNEFVEKVTGMGGIYNASTDTADTDYFIKSPLHKKDDLENFLTMHANMLHYPVFTEKMLEKEKGPVISEIQMYQDDPYDKAYNEMIKGLFGIEADYQGLIAGSSEIIKNLTRDDVVKYYNQWYSPDNMLTVIVGDVDPDKTINLASSLLNRKKAAARDTGQPKYYEPLNITSAPVRKDLTSPQVNSVLMSIGMAGPGNNNVKDTVAMMGLMSALTGYKNARLTQALKPFNAGASADMGILSPDYNAPQLIGISANFTPGQQEEGLKAVYSVLHGMTQQPLTPREMYTIRNKLKDNLLSASESSMNLADMVGNSIVGHGDIGIYTNIDKHIESLTPQDIQAAAQKYLNLSRASIVMMHPEHVRASNGGGVSFKGNSDKFKFNYVKEYDLPNNLHVAINDNPHAIKTSVNLNVKADEIKTFKPGAGDILSVMMNRGTGNYSEEQLNRIIDTYNLGIAVNADSGSINLTAGCPREMLPTALRVMKDMLYNPDLSQEKFDEAKEKVRLTYSSMMKKPGDRALEALYPDYLWGETTRKVLENIDKLTLSDVQALHRQLIADSQGIAVIDGPISSTPGLGQVVFTELQSGIGFNKPHHPVLAPESRPLSQNLVIAEPEQRSQADIVQVFKIKESGNIKDHAALLLMNEILGGNSLSRLFMDLRESQKLAYRVKSVYSSDGKYGNIALTIKTTTEDDLKGPSYDNLKESIEGFRKHINMLKTAPVSQKELEAAKLEVKTDLSNSLEFSAGRAGRIQAGFNTLYGSQYNNALYDAIDQVNAHDIQNAANLYLSQPSVISLIASPATVENTKSYLSSLGNLQIVDSN